MANADSVAQNTAVSFGSYAIASATSVPLSATGNAVIAMPFFNGGLTVGATAGASGSVIIRRVTVQNATGNVAAANVTIYTSNDGNTSNAVCAATILSAMTGAGKYQDLTVASPYSVNTAIPGTTTQALYVGVNTASANGTVDIRVYGDTVAF